jgi:hypothetical protein
MLAPESAFDEARLLHPGDSGWFAIMRRLPNGKVMSKMHPMAHLDIVTRAVERAPDVYLSQSSFSSSRRRITSFANVRAAWVDIDCYHMEREAGPELIQEIVDRAVQVGLPKPTYIVKSGRGLYAKWIFREEVGPANLPVWNALQSSLCATFKAIGADVRARDIARVLRPLGSINSKAPQSPVHLAWQNTDLVDFESLCLAASEVRIEPTVREKIEQTQRLSGLRTAERARRDLADLLPSITHLDHLDRYAQTREPIMMPAQDRSLRALNWRRFTDLRQLAHLRGGIHRGSRDSFIFWMMVSLANCGVVTRQNFFSELAELSKTISSPDFQPLHDGSMGSLYDRLGKQLAQGKAAVYTPSNAKLIDLLEISQDEQRQLTTLISPIEKRRRSDEQAPGRETRRQELQRARKVVMDLVEQGANVTEAAKEAGVDRRQVYRWRQAARLRVQHPKAVMPGGRAKPVSSQQTTKGHIVGQVADMLNKRMSRSQICLELGLGESAWTRICKTIKRCGLLKTPPAEAVAEGGAEQGSEQIPRQRALQDAPSIRQAGPRSGPRPIVVSPALLEAKRQERLHNQYIGKQAAQLVQQANILNQQAQQLQSGLSLQTSIDLLKERLRQRGIQVKPTAAPQHDPRATREVHGAALNQPGAAASVAPPQAVQALMRLREQAREARLQADQLLERIRPGAAVATEPATKAAGAGNIFPLCVRTIHNMETTQGLMQVSQGPGDPTRAPQGGKQHGGQSSGRCGEPAGSTGFLEKSPGGAPPPDSGRLERAAGRATTARSANPYAGDDFFADIFEDILGQCTRPRQLGAVAGSGLPLHGRSLLPRSG